MKRWLRVEKKYGEIKMEDNRKVGDQEPTIMEDNRKVEDQEPEIEDYENNARPGNPGGNFSLQG